MSVIATPRSVNPLESQEHRAPSRLVDVACVLFAFAHWQQTWPALTPISLVFLVVVARGTVRPARSGLLLFVGAGIAYLTAISVVNGTIATDGLLAWVQTHGRILYTLVLIVVFERVARIPATLELLVRRGVQVAAALSCVYLLAYAVALDFIPTPLVAGDNRPLGLLDGTNPTAGAMGAALLLGLAQRRLYPVRALNWLWLLPTAVVFARCLSRGYSLALAVAIVFVAYQSRHRLRRDLGLPIRIAVVSGLVLLGVVTLVAARFSTSLGEDRNVETRLELWQHGIDMWEQSPLTGFGLGSFQQTNLETQSMLPGILGFRESGEYVEAKSQHDIEGGLHSHNVYVQMLAETGLIGLGGYAFLWFIAVKRARPPSGFFVGSQVVYLGVAGLTAGLTFMSPPIVWPALLALAMAWRPAGRWPDDGRRASRASGNHRDVGVDVGGGREPVLTAGGAGA